MVLWNMKTHIFGKVKLFFGVLKNNLQ